MLVTAGLITVVIATAWVLNSIDFFGIGDAKPNADGDNNLQNDAAHSGEQSIANTGPGSGNPVQPIAKIAERPVQLHFHPEPLRYFRETEINGCWNLVRQSILELEITRDGKVWYVPAVILDSRGWIATSYSAVVGANSIIARLAPTNPDESSARRDLSAPITRFVSADPEMDLVLLEVDRRLIELIKPIQLLPKTPVGGTYLVGIGPVFNGWKRWGMETQIASPTSYDVMGIFFDHDRPASGPHPGTPLFDIQGRLAGISTAVFVDGRHRAIDSGWISKWVAELKTRFSGASAMQPISALDRNLAIAEYQPPSLSQPAGNQEPENSTASSAAIGEVRNPALTGNEPVSQAGRNVSLTKLQRQMQQSADVCQKFGFVPTSNEEYRSLTGFADALDQARVLLEIPDGEAGALNRNEWRNLDRVNQNVMEMAMLAINDINRFRMEDANRIAMETSAAGAGNGSTILFADTLINSMTSPQIEGQPTAVFQVLGQDSGIVTVVDPERHVFRDGTRWMLVGRIQGLDTQSVKTRENEVVKCRHFELLLPVGPLR